MFFAYYVFYHFHVKQGDLLGVEAADDDGGKEGDNTNEHSNDKDEDLHPADTGGSPHLQYRDSLDILIWSQLIGQNVTWIGPTVNRSGLNGSNVTESGPYL